MVVTNPSGKATADALLNVLVPFKLESVSVQSEGQVHFALSGETGGRYEIDRSEDFTNWQPWIVATNITGLIDFTDPLVPAIHRRFYRALLLPSP